MKKDKDFTFPDRSKGEISELKPAQETTSAKLPEQLFIDGYNLMAGIMVMPHTKGTPHHAYQHVFTCDYGSSDPAKYAELNKANAAEIVHRYNQFPVLLEALGEALKAFRRMYDDYEGGKDFDDIMNDASYWPLTKIREAIESADTKQ